MDRWTIKQLKDMSDIDFAIAILNERRAKVTPYSPLGTKLTEAAHTLSIMRRGQVVIDKLSDVEIEQLHAMVKNARFQVVPVALDAPEELQAYREIGEIEYLRGLVQRDMPELPYKESLADRNCPKCGAGINWDALNDPMEYAPAFCSNCGQRFDWGREEE